MSNQRPLNRAQRAILWLFLQPYEAAIKLGDHMKNNPPAIMNVGWVILNEPPTEWAPEWGSGRGIVVRAALIMAAPLVLLLIVVVPVVWPQVGAVVQVVTEAGRACLVGWGQ